MRKVLFIFSVLSDADVEWMAKTGERVHLDPGTVLIPVGGRVENLYFVPIFRHAFVNAIGPQIKAEKWQDVFPTITSGYAYPWEEIQLKDAAAQN